MNNGEFYVPREYNYVGENKNFPAEIYKKSIEENPLGNETADYGKELTTLQKKKAPSKDGSNRSGKTLIDKMLNSIKSVTTTAAVAASALIVTTVAANSVSVDHVTLDVGCDYVEYEMQITDASDDCFVIISTPGEEDIEIEIQEDGVHKKKVEGLKPDCAYTLCIVTRDSVFGDVTHFEQSFNTKPEEQDHDPPDSYEGEYEIPTIDAAFVNWSEGKLTVPIVFEKIGEKYYYTLTATDEHGNVIRVIKGSESADAVIELPQENGTYKFLFEIYGVGTNEERLIVSHELEELELVWPKVDITDISLAGENLIKVSFNCLNAENVTLHMEYADGTYDDIVLEESEISDGYVEISVPQTAKTISVTPIIPFETYTLTGQAVQKEFTNNLEVDVSVSLSDYDMSIEFRINAIMNGATYLHVESPDDESCAGDHGIWDGKASVFYNERSQMSFTLYLTDDTGARLSNEVSITVDTTQIESSPEYVMNYRNPGDIGVTYNDDGTINVYVYTDFECEDEQYYCQVELGRYVIKSREKLVVFKNLPNDIYPIKYSVSYTKDGVQYSIMSVTPSGTVNELHFNEYCTLEGNVFTITVGDPPSIDVSNIKIISSDGQEKQITESDLVLNDAGDRVATLEFDIAPDYVTVCVMICTNSLGAEFVEEYGGSIYTPYETNVYP